MRRGFVAVALIASLFGWFVPGRSYTLQYTDGFGTNQLKWPTTTITVAFSTSLSSPGPNIKPGSDVVGAARRALAHWSAVSNIRFIETSSTAQSISPLNTGDGVSLITVADTASNRLLFPAPPAVVTGRTRVFFNPNNNQLTEADITINPSLQFSTDGSVGTYDLESTFTHELGHLLGLEHSGVVGATMQPGQGQNGFNGLPVLTERSLSEDDRAGVRSIYGPNAGLGAIAGTITDASGPLFGAHVWAERISSGRVIAGNITLANGSYRIDSLPPGTYRLIVEYLDEPILAAEIAASSGGYTGLSTPKRSFSTIEIATQFTVSADSTSRLDAELPNTMPQLNPRIFGINGVLSTVAVPLSAGQTYTIYVGGEGMDQVFATGVSVTSPYVAVNRQTFARLQFPGFAFPIISFDVTVAQSAPAGEYSLRLVSSSGEIAYVSGGLSVDYAGAALTENPIDDARFFIRQHYLDFLNREPDRGGWDYWTGQITQCGADQACISSRRIGVSAAFFIEPEFQDTGFFVYRLYRASFARRPTFAEFIADRRRLVGANLEANKQALVSDWVQRPEFLQNYPLTLSAAEFVNKLFDTAGLTPYASERQQLASDLQSGLKTRAQVVRQVVEIDEFRMREFNAAFVLMQYFGYLRRDPDQGGYDFWLNILNNRLPNDASGYRSMVCAFINSAEYQQRFSIVVTRNDSGCSP
jgi:hypothetical protein